ncbi:MAG: hypothetical protein OXG25_15655 [Gammaproteobacteria bacterium]|nr:hypothetical protein [Gammaproteobacteria bacterium]
MYDDFSYLGTWWLPSNKQDKWSGVVSYRPGIGVELELVAKREDIWFEPSLNNVASVEIMQGEVGQYPHRITLLNVSVLFKKFSPSRTSRMFYVPLGAEFLLLGNHYEKKEEITFKSVEVIYSSLGSWMASVINRIRRPWKVSVTFKKTKAEIVLFNAPQSYPAPQESYIEIVPDADQGLDWYCEVIDSLRNLLALLVGSPIASKKMSTPTDLGQVWESQFVSISHCIQPIEDTHEHDMVFPLARLNRQVSDVFPTWFEWSEDELVPYSLCLDVINDDCAYSTFEFLALVQALESYHRLYYEEPGVSEGKYKKENGEVNKDGPTLMDRLKELNENFPASLSESIDLTTEFLTRVKDSRNYYSHYNSDGKDKAMIDTELDDAISRLIPFIAYFLYRRLNISKDVIIQAFEQANFSGLWQRPWPEKRETVAPEQTATT